MHACDGQTDREAERRTDRILLAIPRLHYMQRGKVFFAVLIKYTVLADEIFIYHRQIRRA